MESRANKRRTITDDSSKRRRQSITLEQKVDVLERYARGDRKSKIGSELSLNESTVRNIIRQEGKIKEKGQMASAFGDLQTHTRNRSVSMIQMERLLSVWIEDCNQKRIPLSKRTIQTKAQSLFTAVKRNGNHTTSEETFTASTGWFERFKKRTKLHNVKMLGETASADHEAAARYPETLKRIVEEGGYTEQQIFNVDETGLFWKRMPTRTYLSHNETTQHGYTVSKDRLTLLLGGNAKGDFKVKPMLVYRSPNPRALKGHSQQSLPVIWRANKKAWITKALFEEWFSTCFCPAVEQYCKRKNIAYKALLILDNAPGHPITLGQFNESVKVTFLPPNTTSLIQPMDQAIIGTFKAYYLRETFQQAIAKTTDDHPISLVQFWKNYNIKNAIDNIANAWQKVSENNMRAGWKFIMPHCANNLRDLPAQIQHVIEEITDMGINKLGMEDLDAENVKEMIESHSEELINEDLLNLDQHCAFVDEDDDDEQPSRNKKSDFSNKDFEEIFSMVETLKQKVMDADPNTDRSTRIRREMDSIFLPYEQIYEQRKMVKPAQTTLMQFFDMDK